MICNVCPRKCNVDLENRIGFCGKSGNKIKIAKVMKHFFEEPVISGTKGSGGIFFSYCNLKCIFCQNYEISHLGNGRYFSTEELASLFKTVEEKGVHNINLVSPTQYSTEILEALKIYKPKIPVVWNSNGYEDEKILKSLKGFVDIFLFDFKYFDSSLSMEYSKAKDYFDVCLKALKIAREIAPEDIIENGIMKKGIIVRHLVLPKGFSDSKKIFDEIKKNLGLNFIVSIMSQYLPCYKAKEHEILCQKVKILEYKNVVSHVKNLGFKDGFIQDFESSSKEYIPDFKDESFFKDL